MFGVASSSLRVWGARDSKTHGNSGFENDVEDLETDLLAAHVANDVPAAFCAPEVFVDAAMVASDSWVSLFGAALSMMRCFAFRLTTLVLHPPKPDHEEPCPHQHDL